MMLYQCDKCGKTTPQGEEGQPVDAMWIELSEKIITFNSVFVYHFCYECSRELFKLSGVKRKSEK